MGAGSRNTLWKRRRRLPLYIYSYDIIVNRWRRRRRKNPTAEQWRSPPVFWTGFNGLPQHRVHTRIIYGVAHARLARPLQHQTYIILCAWWRRRRRFLYFLLFWLITIIYCYTFPLPVYILYTYAHVCVHQTPLCIYHARKREKQNTAKNIIWNSSTNATTV